MKRSLQLSLAIAFALGSANAFALGLGTIQVKSGLNQPLNAEIPVIQGTPGEAAGLIVQLASSEDFDRVGLSRARLTVPLEFALGKNAQGQPVIHVTTKDIVREPFLDFLVEANWSKGKLLREYTVLLDPPVMAPATKGTSAVTVAAKEPERAAAQPLPATKHRPAPAQVPAAPPRKVVSAPRPAAAAPHAPKSGEYGPVERGETLSAIARTSRPDETVSIDQMMLALLKDNPNAFFKDNVNALKSGAILRIPSADEIKAIGSASAAAAAVRGQIEDWRGNAASKPTLVAEAGAPKATARKTAESRTGVKSAGEHLALVPPRAGKESQTGADHPGAGGTGAGSAAVKAELARNKEALASREQETTELKSRVKQLEDLNNKNDKLISLKNSEIADLQSKLKELQAHNAGKPLPAQTPATAMASTAPAVKKVEHPAAATGAGGALTKEDIWGDVSGASASKPTAPAGAKPVSAEPGAAGPTTPSVTAPVQPVTAVNAGAAPAAPSAAPATPATPALATPGVHATAGNTAAAPTPETSHPVPIKPLPSTQVQPLLPPETPWYMEPWALGAAGIVGLILVLLGLAGARKRKPAPATPAARGSIAGAFGDSPLGKHAATPAATAADVATNPEEEALVEQVRHNPEDVGLHLELLSLYYAERDPAKFEATAEEMYAHIADPHQAEWQQARAMGEELCPHNPLFAGAADLSTAAADSFSHPLPPADDFVFGDAEPAHGGNGHFDMPEAAAPVASAEPFAFDETDHGAPAPVAKAAEKAFSFDLPPLDLGAAVPAGAAGTVAAKMVPAATSPDEDFFAGEDAIGTKLDLAKAYLDMGDPEGARSMLEEVLAEGSDLQRTEARKLMAEIR